MKRICIFCGSSFGNDAAFKKQAFILGQILAEKKIGVVYGGAKVGLMGAVADGVLSKDGEVIGVIPYFLQGKEIAHTSLTQLLLVDTMHERKTKMNELSDGVIALPGGYGTLEEFFEMLTWAQLGLHKKPVALLNINNFYDPLIVMINTMVEKKLLKQINRQMLLVSDDIKDLLEQIKNYRAPDVGKWLTKEKV